MLRILQCIYKLLSLQELFCSEALIQTVGMLTSCVNFCWPLNYSCAAVLVIYTHFAMKLLSSVLREIL